MAVDLEKCIIEVMDDVVPTLLVGRASESITDGGSYIRSGICFSAMSGTIGVSALPSIALGVDLPITSHTVISNHEDSTEEPLGRSYTARDEVSDGSNDGFGGALRFCPRISLLD